MLRSRAELSAVSAGLRERAEHPVSGGEPALIGMLGDRLVSVLRSHNTPSTLYYVRADGETYVVKVEFGRAPTLRDEIRWYRNAARRGLPRSLFITGHAGPGLSFLLLKCFGDGSTVDDLALAGESAGQLGRHVASAVDGDMELFHRTQRHVGQDHVHRLTERRLTLRRSHARKFPYLRTLMDVDVVTINGVGLPGVSRCLNRVFGDPCLVSYLTPDRVGMTFGDLHCGNILVREGSTEVVDPRGGPLLPITYDYGKLIQSVEGGYGAVMAGRYVLRRMGNTAYEFAPEVVPGYSSVAVLLAASCDERRYLQSLYYAALHFTAMLPHHASAQEETTALYLCGVSLFDKLLAQLA
ncbi:phosphotransferase [Streptomyces phaeochromogenes]|uniref:phosphotransferase n=1 Tax=Streptomyces phaeochromogenes TaxID=1923 RepID=UPI0027D8B32C|nr:phosphotransferase [Streptomyces phaeochromogenes]